MNDNKNIPITAIIFIFFKFILFLLIINYIISMNNYFRNIYEKAINLEKSYNIENHEEISQYEMDKDFFIGTMVGDVFDIKIFLEKEVGKELSKEEFKNYFTNVNFMKKKFPSLQKYQFSDYEYRNILNECFEEAFKENEDIKKK